ncbi:tripartite tricarboxylate transporter substrate binding protein [Achromobacter sp. GG226]|uniref:Bug family tripartite tricarboxylate transporter substrate binding protein n=1 Tax=Verticiella alkaliphila TaxID=2779529 RepID=UPI001C0AFFAB|nr:tripartite tricarboxylate transporter substrate binding protein [Verticiella sp. GG226]MBU4610785.1 tripartite tricarboxylate transporter substrate binding protein [Verticiella sp. GG226]
MLLSRAFVTLLSTCALAGPIMAQPVFPTQPVTLVAPVPPGGTGDTIARLLGNALEPRLGKTVVVDNRPGANTSIGTVHVLRAKPDGHTLLVTGAPTLIINPGLYPDNAYGIADFDYVGKVAAMPMVLLTHPKSGLRTVDAVAAAARKDPGGLSYGSFGNGSMPNVIGERFAQRAGVSLLHVPFQGSAPSLTALMGGQTQLAVDSLVAAAPHLRSGALTAIAITSATRSPLLPDVPTFAEQGLDDLVVDNWVGVVGPKGIPAPTLERLRAVLAETLADASVQQRLVTLGFQPAWEDGDALEARATRELAANTEILKLGGLRP